MPPATALSRDVLIAAAVVLAVAAALAIRQWYERANRPPASSDPEERHDRATDRRRWLVSAILGLIGLAMIASTRIELRVGPPLARREAARLWSWTWLSILALVLVILLLALVDWLAGRAFALQEARRLAEDHRALLADALRKPKGEPDDDL
jgi:MFS family permease